MRTPPRKVAMAVMIQGGEYLLEERLHNTANGAIGRMGCFGGGIERMETAAQAVWREVVLEETVGLGGAKVEDFVEKGEVKVESDRGGKPVTVHAMVFELQVPADNDVQGKKGRKLVRRDMAALAIAKAEDRLTPPAAAALIKYYGLK